MKALVFHHPGKVSVDDVPDPGIEEADDVILRVGEIAFDESAGSAVGYKFVIFRADETLSPEREKRGVRRRLAPFEGTGKWRDHWDS